MIFTPKSADSFIDLFSSSNSQQKEALLSQFLNKMLKIDDEASFYRAVAVLENPIILETFPDIQVRKQQALAIGLSQLEEEQEQENITSMIMYSIEKRSLFYMTELGMVSQDMIVELRSKIFDGAENLERMHLLNPEELKIEVSEETLNEVYESINNNSNNTTINQSGATETSLSAQIGFHKIKGVPAELIDQLNENPVKSMSSETEENNNNHNSLFFAKQIKEQAHLKQALKRLEIIHKTVGSDIPHARL